MTSPFHEAPGMHMYGDLKFEWRSLLNTPCYGFNGPNACYSSTCTHNPSLSESEKQLTKSKLSFPSKKSNYNGRKTFNGERVVDHNVSKSSLISHSTVQMNAVVYHHMYDDFEQTPNSDDYHFDGRFNQNQLLYDESPLHRTKEFNLLDQSPNYYYNSSLSNSPFSLSNQSDESSFESINSPLENMGSSIKHTFNPLSEPFHPMQKAYSGTSSPTSFSSSSSISCEDTPIESIAGDLPTPTITPFESYKEPKQFVCILCPEIFNTLDELQNHIKNKVQEPYLCVICGVSYAHAYSLQRHLRNHRGLKTFNCRGCHKKFRNLNQLRKHYEFCRYKLYIFI